MGSKKYAGNHQSDSLSQRAEYTGGTLLIEDVIVPGAFYLMAALILLPVFSAARQKAHQTTCASNLKRTGFALLGYVEDYDGMTPPLPSVNRKPAEGDADKMPTWFDALLPYTKGGFSECPDRDVPSGWTEEQKANPVASGYTCNGNLAKAVWPNFGDKKSAGLSLQTIANPALTVAVFDGRVGSLVRNSPDSDSKDANGAPVSPAATRHRGGANYLFADGHVKWLEPKGLRTDTKSDGVHPGFGL